MELYLLYVSIPLWFIITILIIDRKHDKRMIKDLQNRLMARSYTEYRIHEGGQVEPPKEPTREPKSWYDDPMLDKEG